MAGSWGALVYRRGAINNYSVPMHGMEYEFTADAAAATIPDKPVADVSGWLNGVDVEFDGTAPPNSLTVAIKTVGGITIATNTVALTASGRIAVEPPVPFAGGLIISCSGNSTNSAKAKIIPLVSPA